MMNKIKLLLFYTFLIFSFSVNSLQAQDTDGDGIANSTDLDDDNDGILDTVECPSITNHPVYHLYDPNEFSSTNFLDLYKQLDGIGSTFVCPVINCSVNPLGAYYKTTNIAGSITNLAYDDSKYYTVDAAGNLLYTTDIIAGNFTNLGSANLGTGFKNLAYDNGIFYHWKRVGEVITIYSSPNPVTTAWTLMGTVINRTYTITSGGYTFQLVDMAVDDGVFYFMYHNTSDFIPDAIPYTIAFSSSTPLTGTWSNLGDTDFGSYVYNIAIGSEDLKVTCDTDGDGLPNSLDLDSDNDGCPDALEGGANITNSQLVTAGGTLQGGNGVDPAVTPTSGTYNQAVLLNLCNGTTCVGANGVPIAAGGGQSVGDSQNASVSCQLFCYKPATTTGTSLPAKQGITALGRAGANNGNWPMVRNGAWTVLEAKTKGFVVNRLTTLQKNALTPVEGMMVYDTNLDCLSIYDGTGWKCFNTQTCPQ